MSDWENPKRCNPTHGCGLLLPRSEFRILSHGWLAAYCRECERIYERERWHRRMGNPAFAEREASRESKTAKLLRG